MLRTLDTVLVGNALSLTGNGYIRTSPLSSAQTNFSVFTWVYITSYPGTGIACIFKNGESGWGNGGYSIRIGTSGIFAANFEGTATGWSSGVTLTLNTWYHVGLVSTNNSNQLWINGATAGSAVGGQPNGIQVDSVLGAIHTTVDGSGTGGSYGSFFTGRLDDFRIYDRVLSASEISILAGANATNNIDTVSTSGLKTWWKFDETQGAISNELDSSGNGRTGPVTNGTIVGGKVYIVNLPNRTVTTSRSAAGTRILAESVWN